MYPDSDPSAMHSARTGSAGSTSAPLLSIAGMVKQFGEFRALDGVSFSVGAGEIVGLVGPNGSGKTTCINVITGLYAPDGGSVRLLDRSIAALASHRIVHLGVNRTFQVPRPFMSLTVRENLQVAATYSMRGTTPADIESLLALLELSALAERRAESLNSVHLKLLDLGRALATKPRLLCLDELAAGFNPTELAALVATIRTIAAQGVAIVVVEHLMGFIDDVTDRVIVLNAGKKIFAGKLTDAVKDPRVMEVFLGTSDD